nr:MAG TPA: hypothetical protein [Caudoviricetes sp.]DAO21756.1 MAG TPA: hypothetical protein [Caudoviricetes sp.]
MPYSFVPFLLKNTLAVKLSALVLSHKLWYTVNSEFKNFHRR